jgi:hypothetical protein
MLGAQQTEFSEKYGPGADSMKSRTQRRFYLREASVTLLMAQLATRFVSPVRLLALVNRPLRRINRFAVDEIDWVSWAIDTVAAERWSKAPPLPIALAVQLMLRRRRVASRLCLGAVGGGEVAPAPAWIELTQDGITKGPGTRMLESGGERP